MSMTNSTTKPNLRRSRKVIQSASFHGFHDVSEALTAAKHGLSGAEKADRRYSYEFSNNPKGLFVTMSLDVAKEFTSKVIMEFVAREDQLEAPVWPGGGLHGPRTGRTVVLPWCQRQG